VRFLLDTNIVSETIRLRPHRPVMAWLDGLDRIDAGISIVTKAELVDGVTAAPDEKRRRELARWLDDMVQDWLGRQTLPLTDDVLVDCLKLSRRLAGRGLSRKGPDLLIASTARVHRLTLVTRNVRDFADTGLVVYDPWDDETHRMDKP
jgi:predicted nucleic acid-binding protein